MAELHFHMLAPGRDQITGSMRPNDDCLVFTAAFGGTTALLEGDAERPAERRVVEEHPEAMLLKVAHHGSASGTSADLLATVHPRYAVISVGARNVYGHPRREVLERLQQAGVKTYRPTRTARSVFISTASLLTARRRAPALNLILNVMYGRTAM